MKTFQQFDGTRAEYLEYCRTSKELHAAMVSASQVDDIDTAVASIQDLVGVADGGFAGMFFDDFEWNNSPATVRLYRLRSYVENEILHYVQAMTFEAFKATRRHVDNLDATGLADDVNEPGLVYADAVFIIERADGYSLIIGNTERESSDLAALERDLFTYYDAEN